LRKEGGKGGNAASLPVGTGPDVIESRSMEGEGGGKKDRENSRSDGEGEEHARQRARTLKKPSCNSRVGHESEKTRKGRENFVP